MKKYSKGFMFCWLYPPNMQTMQRLRERAALEKAKMNTLEWVVVNWETKKQMPQVEWKVEW